MSGGIGRATPLVSVENLTVAFGAAAPVVKGVSFSIARGETVALIGESGSGKSVSSRSLVGLAGQGARVVADELRFGESDLRKADARLWRKIRGGRIGFVMQDALGSLDPLRTVGDEVGEALRLHTDLSAAERRARVIELLAAAGVPEPEVRALQLPSQLSGGLRQRALIASAIACQPDLLIADEPTTALDAAVQAQVLRLLESLRTSDNAMLVVSHDFAVVSRLADRVVVMRRGEIVEQGTAGQILQDPRHPYTKDLLSAARSLHGTGARRRTAPSGKIALGRQGLTPQVIQAKDIAKSFRGPDARRRTAVAGVSLEVKFGETLGLVGESGSGKTTVTRLILGLETPDTGQIFLRGRPWAHLSETERRAERRLIQVVFQDPLASFDPRYTVERVLGEAIEVAGVRARAERRARAIELLGLVQLDEGLLTRRPMELSGGQRQRVAIARALAPRPEVLICDEPVSALDVSVQVQILNLLEELKTQLGLACIFISHDLGVVRRVSDRVAIMKAGEIVEQGETAAVFGAPRHPYTRELLAAIPQLNPTPEAAHA
jgi:peptide/nickel transport system ATP-binding protein